MFSVGRERMHWEQTGSKRNTASLRNFSAQTFCFLSCGIPGLYIHISSIMRQKGESQNDSYKKTKHTKFSEKTNISDALIRTHVCLFLTSYKDCSFFEKFGVLCFFVIAIWNSLFCLITDDLPWRNFFPSVNMKHRKIVQEKYEIT